MGSNPTLSASSNEKGLPSGRPFSLLRTEEGGIRRLARTRARLSESPIYCRFAAGRLRRLSPPLHLLLLRSSAPSGRQGAAQQPRPARCFPRPICCCPAAARPPGARGAAPAAALRALPPQAICCCSAAARPPGARGAAPAAALRALPPPTHLLLPRSSAPSGRQGRSPNTRGPRPRSLQANQLTPHPNTADSQTPPATPQQAPATSSKSSAPPNAPHKSSPPPPQSQYRSERDDHPSHPAPQ